MTDIYTAIRTTKGDSCWGSRMVASEVLVLLDRLQKLEALTPKISNHRVEQILKGAKK